MPASHAQIARTIAASQSGAFAQAAAVVPIHNDFTQLERMFPGVAFSSRKSGPDEVELIGVCADGSQVTWILVP